MCVMCLTSAFQQSRHWPWALFSLCGMTGATGFGVLSLNPALAGLQRKEGRWCGGESTPTAWQEIWAWLFTLPQKNIPVDLGCVSYTLCSTTVPPSVKMWKIFTYLAENWGPHNWNSRNLEGNSGLDLLMTKHLLTYFQPVPGRAAMFRFLFK